MCWQTIASEDSSAFGRSFTTAFEAQVAMFPHMLTDNIRDLIDVYRDKAFGWKLSGAGGGGYLILVADRPIQNAIQIKIRRQHATF